MANRSYKLTDKNLIQNMQNYGPMSPENIAELYSSIAHLLSNEQREYLDKMMQGEADTDALLDLEMFFRIVNVYAMQAVAWSLEERKVTKDIGGILGEVRQGAVAIENMRTKRNEVKAKIDDTERVVDPTRKPTLSFLQSLAEGSDE